jgi:hypothetical protein
MLARPLAWEEFAVFNHMLETPIVRDLPLVITAEQTHSPA